MAVSQFVTLAVGSEFGFRRPVMAPVPIMETIKDTNTSTVSTGTLASTSSKVISISVPTDFVIPVGTIPITDIIATYGVNYNDYLKTITSSTKQTIYITNVGTAAVTLFPNSPYRPTFSLPTSPGVFPVLHSAVGTQVLSPGTTASIELSYYGTDLGEFSSFFNITSNAQPNTCTIFTSQSVGSVNGFTVDPLSFTTSTQHYSQDEVVTYNITPAFNGISRPDLIVPISGSITGGPAWSIIGTGDNSVTVKFSPDEINNANGTYNSILTITANGQTRYITNSVTLNINTATNMNLSKWLSPVSYNDSIVGISYDLEEDKRILTIGVGLSNDIHPVYQYGGYIYDKLGTLGLHAAHLASPYPYWAEVYRIELTGNAQVYCSGDTDAEGNPLHLRKFTEDQTYGYYFGEYKAPGSMFIVEDDGYGSIKVELNHLRELSNDTALDTTLQNLTRAFYYYSNVDVPPRPSQLPATEYVSPISSNTSTTYLFTGFNYNTSDKTAVVNKSIVALPT